MGTANIQSQLWGARARDWAEIQEALLVPLYEAVLHKTAIGANHKILDIGCGSGMFCQMAAQFGAQVCGLDAAEPLLTIALESVSQGDFRTGEMEELPYSNQTFDVDSDSSSYHITGQ